MVRFRSLLVIAVVGMNGVAAVVQAAPAMRIAVLVDNSSATLPAMPQMRTALAAFVDALPAGTEVALITTGRRSQVRVAPTTDLAKVKSNVGGLLTENGPTALMDSLQETEERFLRKPGDHQPVLVVITGTGSESSKDNDEQSFNRWLNDTVKRGLSAHAVVLKTAGQTLPEIIASTLVKATGGHYSVMSSGAAMADALTTLAGQLAADASKRP